MLIWPVGSEERVNELTKTGYPLRFTGDGYYESVIGDPEGNQIEITI